MEEQESAKGKMGGMFYVYDVYDILWGCKQ